MAENNAFSQREEFEKKFQSLPKDVQEAVESVDSAKILKEVADKHHLHLDQTGSLTDVTSWLMFGEANPSQYIFNIQKKVRVDEKTAREIAAEINQRIFAPIQESLKKMYHIGGAEKNTEEKKLSSNAKKEMKRDPYRESINFEDEDDE
ncbi:MAG TPA: hypothetical protein VFM02_00445 [Candidatus Paceibacterota bacterium]|nr:hypothetical protein [Candidatus Paceibacterota bacterium]